MTDWIQTTGSALHDAAAWRLFRRMFAEGLVEEGWHYALITSIVWLTLHVLLRRRLASRLIGLWPSSADIRREIAYSLSTVVVFAGIAAAVVAMLAAKQAEIYARPLAHGVWWLVVSLPLLIVWHDCYFYWTHRLLHTRWLFRHIHAVHHRSRHPSPWSAYSFHPLEALNSGVMFLLALWALPFNETVLTIFGLHQILRNAIGHAGVETMPAGFVRHPLWGRFTTTTHHHLHHEASYGNYGLWFTWWDRWCGTERQEYMQRFDATSAQPPTRAS